MLPGGVMNPDKLRMLPEAVEFARAFYESGKPIAAICHGPQILIDADVVRGHKLVVDLTTGVSKFDGRVDALFNTGRTNQGQTQGQGLQQGQAQPTRPAQQPTRKN